MSKALSTAQLNSAWIQGLVDAYYTDPFKHPIPQCPYDKDSDLAELWHYGAQYAAYREGVTIEGFANDDGKPIEVSEEVMRAMTQMNQPKEPQP